MQLFGMLKQVNSNDTLTVKLNKKYVLLKSYFINLKKKIVNKKKCQETKSMVSFCYCNFKT